MPTLAYISPQFPARSLVFEQNELLGLVEIGADLLLISVRRPAGADAEPDAFAAPLCERVRYVGAVDVLRGLAWALARRPVALFRSAAWTLGAALRHPRRAGKNLAAWAIAVGAAPIAHRRKVDWIHADFVQGTAATAWHLSRLLGVPYSATAHAFDIYSTDAAKRDSAALFARRLSDAAFLHVVSEFGRGHLLPQLPSRVHDRVSVQHVSVRAGAFTPSPFPTGTAHVIGLGRLVPKKGFNHLVDAVDRMRDKGVEVTCSIWGEGECEAELRRQIARRGLKGTVTLHGRYTQEQLPRIFGDALALVVPSVVSADDDMDGIPTVIFEAMACGRPVVASSLSGIPEAVEHGVTGLLVPPGDAGALAEALAEIALDQASAERMGRVAREWVREAHDHVAAARALLAHIEGAREASV